MPEYRLSEQKKVADGTNWIVTLKLENIGAGVMPVEVAAARGERFAKDGTPAPDYRNARATIALGKGESRDVIISCPFDPQRIVVDPDAKVLQVRRKTQKPSFEANRPGQPSKSS